MKISGLPIHVFLFSLIPILKQIMRFWKINKCGMFQSDHMT